MNSRADSARRRFFEARVLALAVERPAEDLLHATVLPGARAERPAHADARRHVADCYEFAFVVEGRARIATAHASFTLAPGKLLLIDRGVDHEELPTSPSGRYTVFWCGAHSSLVRLGETSHWPPSRFLRGPMALLDGRTDIESIMEAIASELYRQDWGWLRSVHGLLHYLASILVRRLRRGQGLALRQTESLTVDADPRTWRIIRDALRLCDTNFRQPVRLTDVAAAVGYSPDHVSRLFVRHVGCSFSDYLRRLRITAAQALLTRPDLTIGDIARDVGYSDPTNFSHAFTRDVGIPPTLYRQRLRGL